MSLTWRERYSSGKKRVKVYYTKNTWYLVCPVVRQSKWKKDPGPTLSPSPPRPARKKQISNKIIPWYVFRSVVDVSWSARRRCRNATTSKPPVPCPCLAMCVVKLFLFAVQDNSWCLFVQSRILVFDAVLYKIVKYVSCEFDWLHSWYSILQACFL